MAKPRPSSWFLFQLQPWFGTLVSLKLHLYFPYTKIRNLQVTIRHIGGFLSLYALSKEKFYIDKARSTADQLLLAFDTPTGIPRSLVIHLANLLQIMDGRWVALLFCNPIYRDKVQKVRDALDNAKKINGLYPNYMSPETGKFQGDHISLGAMGDSFYETLLKSWIRSRKDKQAYKMYKEASAAIRKHMVFKSKGGLSYLAELRNGGVEHKMGHLACFTPGMFALEAINEPDPNEKIAIMQLAEDLGETCHESYVRAAARIGPEMFYFEEGTDAMTTKGDAGYILRPEVIEGWFLLVETHQKQEIQRMGMGCSHSPQQAL
uniref:alpha-1,2-Mannosidase n=1 Tax=Ditylenchus dipsaci TaxID=166011 RepID=A0A915D616_9BILA